MSTPVVIEVSAMWPAKSRLHLPWISWAPWDRQWVWKGARPSKSREVQRLWKIFLESASLTSTSLWQTNATVLTLQKRLWCIIWFLFNFSHYCWQLFSLFNSFLIWVTRTGWFHLLQLQPQKQGCGGLHKWELSYMLTMISTSMRYQVQTNLFSMIVVPNLAPCRPSIGAATTGLLGTRGSVPPRVCQVQWQRDLAWHPEHHWGTMFAVGHKTDKGAISNYNNDVDDNRNETNHGVPTSRHAGFRKKGIQRQHQKCQGEPWDKRAK